MVMNMVFTLYCLSLIRHLSLSRDVICVICVRAEYFILLTLNMRGYRMLYGVYSVRIRVMHF